jgi:membrane-associated phospholipid phosphatase
MKIRYFLAALLIILPTLVFSQQTDSLSKKLDSARKAQVDTAKNRHNDISQENYNPVTKLNAKTYFILLGSDLKQEITAPFHIKSKDLPKIGAFLVITGSLMLVDEPVNSVAMDMRNRSETVVGVSKYVTRFGGPYEAYTLLALGMYGFVFKNEKIKTTTLLATQAYICGSIAESLKFLAGRQRPNYYNPETEENDPTWHGPLYQFKKTAQGTKPSVYSYTSFPSGHTTVAFAAATVFAMEYRDRPLVPVLSYSAATLIGLSRITENRHWASDVFAGATIGYLCGKLVTNNYHRYNRIQKQTDAVTLNLDSVNGKILPALTYHF